MKQFMSTKTYTNVLDFWFGSKSSREYLKEKAFWYGSPSDDAYVRKHLGGPYEEAQNGKLDSWKSLGEGEGALALILLLDQVPRNIFRNTPRAYATDSDAISVARYAIDRGWDKKLPTIQRRYMYSPFNHSEDLKDQETSVELFTELGDSYHLHWAKDFRDQIKRNGRFVHRDRILGRS
ncbi:hypothetical protein N7532_001971 [Penicillium argentinense]|uniref:DUF924-domain-containing protein n=1 Tax=Penicillium argentinense TaxID=1131581 RepID=A0A9W9KMX4_9EURO|nr:uncharacterized protein N7532_001971 [Penicillium argentinense]KAJ5111436.1 hypothetical protein N7532_001971 [Penicillium argentinense]